MPATGTAASTRAGGDYPQPFSEPFATGGQAAVYVRHIRHYYDLLVRADNSERHGQTLVATSE